MARTKTVRIELTWVILFMAFIKMVLFPTLSWWWVFAPVLVIMAPFMFVTVLGLFAAMVAFAAIFRSK